MSAVLSMPSAIRAYELPKKPARILIEARAALTATLTSGTEVSDGGSPGEAPGTTGPLRLVMPGCPAEREALRDPFENNAWRPLRLQPATCLESSAGHSLTT